MEVARRRQVDAATRASDVETRAVAAGGILPRHPAGRWWTRSQRIRTAGELSFEVALLGGTDAPLYQRISQEVEQLHKLGLSVSGIARRLAVTDKTAAKALASMPVT